MAKFSKIRITRLVKRCPASTHDGSRCWNSAIKNSRYCWIHSAQDLMRREFKQYADHEVVVWREAR